MSQGKSIGIVSGVILLAAAWYLFRPELLFVRTEVSEELPVAASGETASSQAEPAAIARGRFHGVAHETKGSATIYRLGDGKRVLRLTDFETSNGPDVQVYLGMARDANDSETVTRAGFARLGPLKGTMGDQNYELPSDVDLSRFHSVTIWCRRFGVNFGTAPLTERGF